MNITELIELLTEVAENNPEAEVRLATQPNWPLAYHLGGVASTQDLVEHELENGEPFECEEHQEYHCHECLQREILEDQEGDVVWLVEGGSLYNKPYAPRKAWEAARSH
jgi:hypothetical protein